MFKPRTVVVPNPLRAISNAEMDVVAVPATVVEAMYKLVPSFLKVTCARFAPAERASCEAVEEKVVNGKTDVVVAIAIAPANVEVAVVVARMLPTVSCVPVAMRTPDPLVVTIEFSGNAARDERGTLETVRAPEVLARPEPNKLLKDDPLTMRLVVEAVAKDE